MIYRVLILVLFYSCLCAQDIPLISLKVKEDTLRCYNQECDSENVTLIFKNESRSDILVYGLKQSDRKSSVAPAFRGLSSLCDLSLGSRTTFALYKLDETLELVIVEFLDYVDVNKNRVTKEMVDSTFRTMEIDFVESGRVLKASEEITLETTILLGRYNLQKGLRNVQFIYYCGKRAAEILDSHGIKRQAPLFQGCAMSVKVPIIISYTRNFRSFFDKR